MDVNALLGSVLQSNESFINNLKRYLSEENYSILDLGQASGISNSTLYKIMSDPTKDFRISTFRNLMKGVLQLAGESEEEERNVIAVITSREALDTLGKYVEMNGRTFIVREYPATTIEEEIIQGVRAEREGVLGILCGPIAATTISKVVRIPVTALRFVDTTLLSGLEKLSQKV